MSKHSYSGVVYDGGIVLWQQQGLIQCGAVQKEEHVWIFILVVVWTSECKHA